MKPRHGTSSGYLAGCRLECWPKAEIARRVSGPQARSLQIRKTRVRASTAAKVRMVHTELTRLHPLRPRRNVRVEVRPPKTCESCGTPWLDHPLTRRCA